MIFWYNCTHDEAYHCIFVASILIIFVFFFFSARQSRYDFVMPDSSHIFNGAVFDRQLGILYYLDGDNFQIVDYPRQSISIKSADWYDLPACFFPAPSSSPASAKTNLADIARANAHNEIMALLRYENAKFDSRNYDDAKSEYTTEELIAEMERRIAAREREEAALEALKAAEARSATAD